MEKAKSMLTGSVACPFCGESIMIGFVNRTKEIIQTNHCAHSGLTDSGDGIEVTFTLLIKLPVEVS